MDKNELNDQDYNQSLIKCEQIDAIIPSVFYAVNLLKRLDSTFFNNVSLLNSEEGLLKLHDLLDIKNTSKVYVHRYREILIDVLQNMSQFILELKGIDLLSPQQQMHLANIMNRLVQDQQRIITIIDSIP